MHFDASAFKWAFNSISFEFLKKLACKFVQIRRSLKLNFVFKNEIGGVFRAEATLPTHVKNKLLTSLEVISTTLQHFLTHATPKIGLHPM